MAPSTLHNSIWHGYSFVWESALKPDTVKWPRDKPH